MAKVVLIDALGWQDGVFNLGLAYLAAGLKAHHHDVRVMDLNNRSRTQAEICAELAAWNPQYVGFSVKSATFANALDLHRVLLAVCPDATYLYGGPHVTLVKDDLLDETPPAFFIRGEAEHALAEFVTRHSQGQADFHDIPGMLYRGADGRVRSAEIAYERNLDDLPLPDFTVFDTFPLFKTYPLLTSRGCPYHCTYCSVPAISGSGWRPRSADSVLREVQHALQVLKMDSVVIVDDNFTLHRGRAEAICREIVARGLRFTWSCANGIRADRIWPELADLMFKAGCRDVSFGIESWDPTVLASLSKGEELRDIRRGIGIAQAAGLKVTGFFMIGLPGSTYRKDLRSLAMARRLRLDNFYFGLTIPYPGTELWDWAQVHARFLLPWQNSYHISEVFRTGLDRLRIEPVFDTPDYPVEERRRLFQLVQDIKAGGVQRGFRKIKSTLRLEGGEPVVVIRSSWRNGLCALLADLHPDRPHILAWKGTGDPLHHLDPGLQDRYLPLHLPGEGYLDPSDAAQIQTMDVSGGLVAFDVPDGSLDRYANVLAFARALRPRQILVLLGERFVLLPGSEPRMEEAP